MGVLVIAEHDNTSLSPATLNTVTAATALGEVTMLVAGANCRPAAEAAAVDGVARVLLADDPSLEHGLAENLAPLIQGLGGEYGHVLAAATTFGKNLLPRVAALLDVQQISEITAIESEDTFVRPIYAGNAMATVQSTDSVKVITVRTTAFEAAQANDEGGGSADIEEIGGGGDSDLSSFVGHELTKSERPELTSALSDGHVQSSRFHPPGLNFVVKVDIGVEHLLHVGELDAAGNEAQVLVGEKPVEQFRADRAPVGASPIPIHALRTLAHQLFEDETHF